MRCQRAKCLFSTTMYRQTNCRESQSVNRQFINDDNNKLKSTIHHTTCRKFHTCQDNQHSWSILQHLYRKQLSKGGAAHKKYACFLLNISDDTYNLFTKYQFIWDDANLKVAVDGSANFLAKRGLVHTADVICGDFDSIEPRLIEKLRCPDEATKFFKPKDQNKNQTLTLPQIIETPAQKETDFTKAIRVAMSKRPDINSFFGLYYSDGSRIDHLFGLVNTLHLIKKDITIVNINSNTISWLLEPGNHAIHKPRGRELCSLVPFTGPTEVKTQGLEYNISPSTPLSFGGLISTSNLCRENFKTINVETNRELLWSIDACF